jgi:hypothetical protein
LRCPRKRVNPIRKYVLQLEKENGQLQKAVASYEAKQLSLENRMKAQEEQHQLKKVDIRYNFNLRRELDQLPEDELIEKLRNFAPTLIRIAPKLGLKIEKLRRPASQA